MKKLLCLLCLALLSCTEKKDVAAENVTSFNDPPAWASEVIWYQIFVERFRNGDQSNDPTPADIEGSYPGFVPENWKVTPWTQDWYSDDVYFPDLEKGEDWFGNPVRSFGSKSQLRRYGGDLQGVLDQMDYLDSLGITAVYFNPLNDAPSLHKYDPRYWRHVDRNFGPDPKGDLGVMQAETDDDPATWQFTAADQMFLRVIEELHSRGIRVILDYSWNHTGHRFWAWLDLVDKQQESKFKDWYWIKSFDDPETEANEFDYSGWFGVKDLPEIRETEYMDHAEGIVIDTIGNVYSEDVKNHIFSITKRWLDPNGDGDPTDGVDGYRLDVAAEMPFEFWREFRKLVREINPNAYLLGEVWWEQWPDKLLDPAPFLKGDVFDSPMNYRWYRSARKFFSGDPEMLSASDFIDSLQLIQKGIRKQNNYSMMNLNGSHDSPRVLTSLQNNNMYKVYAKPAQDSSYLINKPNAATYKKLKLLLAHQYTYIGAPHIWAGDEMGMWGADDPSCRKPLIWPDYAFENEKAHPLGLGRSEDEVIFDYDLFNTYQTLISMRKSNPVLMNGEISFYPDLGSQGVLAYRRFDEESEVLVIINNSGQTQTIYLELVGTFQDLIDQSTVNAGEKKLTLVVPSKSFQILKKVG